MGTSLLHGLFFFLYLCYSIHVFFWFITQSRHHFLDNTTQTLLLTKNLCIEFTEYSPFLSGQFKSQLDYAILQVCHSLKPLRRELFNGKELKSTNIGECCCLMLTLSSKRAWDWNFHCTIVQLIFLEAKKLIFNTFSARALVCKCSRRRVDIYGGGCTLDRQALSCM
jgi:hypothetical protein